MGDYQQFGKWTGQYDRPAADHCRNGRIDYACRYIFLNMFKRLAKRTRNQWDDFDRWAQDYQQADAHDPCHPGVCAVATGFPVDETPRLLGIRANDMQDLHHCRFTSFHQCSLQRVHEIYNRKESLKNKPLKGFIQLLQVAVFLLVLYWSSAFWSANRQRRCSPD